MAERILMVDDEPKILEGLRRTVKMPGMDGAEFLARNGLILLRPGEVLSESMAIRLRHFAAGVGPVEPIAVLV